MKYLEVKFTLSPISFYAEILQSDLCDIGFESFQDDQDGFCAYCQEVLFDLIKLKELYLNFKENNPDVEVEYSILEIEQRNWNQEWERSYPAVRVNDFCFIHAPFHQRIDDVSYNIEISPKMSFGTAHHPTTYQIIEFLEDEPLIGKHVMDMGSGTGVLAILSKLKGAQYVEAIDNDEWAYENAKENVARNNVDVTVRLSDAGSLDKEYDVFIANINRNILLQDMAAYALHIKSGGVLFLSGFYQSDVVVLLQSAAEYGFRLDKQILKENWAALRLIKN